MAYYNIDLILYVFGLSLFFSFIDWSLYLSNSNPNFTI